MKTPKKAYRSEKSSVRDYIWALKGVRVPWLFLALIFAASLASTYAGLHLSFFTGDMVDAKGNVPTADLVRYAASYVGLGAAAAAGVIFTALASERINLGLRTKLWR